MTDLKGAAQSAFTDSEQAAEEQRRDEKDDKVTLARIVDGATKNVVRPKVMLVGGDDRLLQLNWPHSWRVSHYRADARNLDDTLRTGSADLIVVFTRWTPRTLRRSIEKAMKPASGAGMFYTGTPTSFVAEVNKLFQRDVPPALPYPPFILKAKNVKALLRVMLPNAPEGYATPEAILRMCRGMKDAVPALRAVPEEKFEEVVLSNLAAIVKADIMKIEEEQRRQEEEARRAEPKAKPEPPKEEPVLPKETPKDPEVSAMYAAVGALAADTKRKDAWTKEELEYLIGAWEECADDADILLENMRALGSKRSVTGILFQLQRVASSVPGVKVPSAVIDRLKELSVPDRKKSSLHIAELVERPKGSTAVTTPAEPQWTEADRERMWNQSFAPRSSLVQPAPADRFRALAAHIVQGVELGLETKEQAFDRIAALVRG